MNKLVLWLPGIAILLGICLTLASLFLVGVEYDEAWIIASHLSAFHSESVPDVSRVLTTGGLHFLTVGFLGEPGENAIRLARGISMVSLCLILLLIERFACRWIPDFPARMLIILCLVATPGSLFLGSMGYGISLSLFLLLGGVVFWFGYEGSLPVRVGVAGLLFGLALATRWTFLPILPLLVISGAALSSAVRFRWLYGLGVAAVAAVVFGLFVLLQSHLGSSQVPTSTSSPMSANLSAAGISGSLFPTPARLTGFATRYFTLVSIPMVLVSIVFAIQIWPTLLRAQRVLLLALVAASILIALAWMMRSPFLHTRYVWPSVLLLNLACGICLALASLNAKGPDAQMAPFVRLICFALPIGLAVGTYTNGVRVIAAGSGYETNNAGYSSQERHFDAFRLKREQLAIVNFLATIAPDETIMATGLPPEWAAMQLSLMSQLKIENLSPKTDTDTIPSIIISHRFARLSPAGRAWLSNQSLETTTIFGYQVHRINKAQYTPPETDYFVDNAVYLFLTRREQSLSGF